MIFFQVIEVLNYPREIQKPEKQYIFALPKEGLVYDYRFIKEVNIINLNLARLFNM